MAFWHLSMFSVREITKFTKLENMRNNGRCRALGANALIGCNVLCCCNDVATLDPDG